ncbi:hypothetical protein NE237_015271 [Protea cynaroides]|uniref:Uncharacterized protein n=1 Tax=Protea cynaroides TaxID=273540 RepID=A0A9Q0KDQ8_9MAGN|nr:hypothetical protein NE237_015271 [Protea cynaroides]
MTEFLQRFKSISDQLVAYNSIVSDDDIIIFVLDGLPSIYRQFYSSIRIRARTSILTLEELHNLLICEEIALQEESSTDHSTALPIVRPPPLAKPHFHHEVDPTQHVVTDPITADLHLWTLYMGFYPRLVLVLPILVLFVRSVSDLVVKHLTTITI